MLIRKISARNQARCHLRPSIRLALIKSIRVQDSEGREAGITLPVAMLIFFVVSLIAISIANYTTSGLFAASSQADNREARGAAESGMAEVVSQLNKEPNRRLIVAGNSRYTSTGWNISSAGGLYNDCASLSSTGSTVTPIVAPSYNLAPGISNAQRLRGESLDRRRYYIESIAYLDQQASGGRQAYSTPSANTLAGITKSFVRITIVGLSSNGGKKSKSRIAREFEVVPKCCKRSFGSNLINATGYGNDKLVCLNDSRGGSGLIVGLNNGTFSGSGNTFDIKNDDGVPITQARCWSGNLAGTVDSTNTVCAGGTLTIGSTISAVPTDFDFTIPGPLPSIALGTNGQADCSSSTKGNVCIVQGNGQNSVTRNYIRLKSDNSTVEACQKDGNNLNNCLPLSDWGASCLPDSTSSVPSVGCRITRLNLQGADLTIDSSRGAINLYFDNPSCDSVLNTAGSTVTGTTYLATGATANCSTTAPEAHNFLDGANGNGTINHVYCATTVTICTQNGTLNSSDRLNFFVVDPGYLKMKGSTSAVALNIFAPFATVGWAGGGNQSPNFLGRIWSKNLDLQGSISMQVEKTNPGFCSTSNCPLEVGGLIDHKLRNYTQSSGF